MTVRRVTVTNVFGPLNRGDFDLFGQLLDVLAPSDRGLEVDAIARDAPECRRHFPGVGFHEQPGVAPGAVGLWGRALTIWRTLVLFLSAHFGLVERLLPARQRSGLAAIRRADLVVACPGGYLTASTRSFYPQLAQLYYAVRRGRRVWLAPMSIGPAHHRVDRVLLAATLRRAERIYTRESYSEQLCGELEIEVERSADLAFRPARTWLGRPRCEPVCITATVVRWEFPGAADRDRARGRYHAAMAEALDELSRCLDLPVWLLLQVDNDRAVTEEVASRLNVPHRIVRVETPDEYRAILERSRLMVASRFHSAIFAMTAGCPTIVVSYLPKARRMMEDMGLGGLVHDIADVDCFGILRTFARLDDPASGLAVQVRDAVAAAACDAHNPFVRDIQEAVTAGEPVPNG